MLVHTWFEYHARTRPDILFVELDGLRLTYAEANARANCWANALIGRGLKPGDRIAYLSKNHIDMAVMYMACAKAGVAPVMLNYRLVAREWQYILQDADCSLFFGRGADNLAAIDTIRDELPEISDFIAVDTPAPRGWTGLDDFLAEGSDEQPSVAVDPDDMLYLIYTSGTTGRPKGVMITHRNEIMHTEQAMSASCAAKTPGHTALVATPLYHAAGVHRIMTAVITCGSVVLMEDFDAAQFVALLVSRQINTCNMVPSIVQSLLDEIPGIADMDFSALEVIYYGAAPISEPVLRRALSVFKCPLIQGYGLTESCGGIAYLNEFDHQKALSGRPELLRSTGRAVVHAEVRVVDSNQNDMPTGEVGEVIIRGDNVMKGYWRNPEATAQAIRNGWLHSGDAGSMDAEGYLYLQDRIKDMIVSGGTNIYPNEVESALMEHPALADVAVIGVPHEKWGETPLAVCVLRSGQGTTAEELIAFCRDRLGGYKIPRRYQFIDKLPRNPSGKVLKRVLREPYWAGQARAVS